VQQSCEQCHSPEGVRTPTPIQAGHGNRRNQKKLAGWGGGRVGQNIDLVRQKTKSLSTDTFPMISEYSSRWSTFYCQCQCQ